MAGEGETYISVGAIPTVKRRNFLKLVAAAVVCPKGLLEEKPIAKSVEFTERILLSGKKFATYYIDFKPFATEEERERYRARFRRALQKHKFHPPMLRHRIYFENTPCYYKGTLNA